MKDKSFSKQFITIAMPIVLQYFLSSSLQLIDSIMIGKYGAVAIASVGIGNQVFFVINLILYGISSGVGVFVAQFVGKKDEKACRMTLALGVSLASVITIVTMFVILFFSKEIVALFTNDVLVIEEGARYIWIISLSRVLTGLTYVFSSALRSVGNSKMPLLASFSGVMINTLGNYILIFGIGEFMGLGVTGAAIATAFARVVEFSILMFNLYKSEEIVKVTWKDFKAINKRFIKKYSEQTSVLIAKDFLWGIGSACFLAIYSRMSTDSVASINIVNTIRSLGYILLAGISSACVVLIGKCMGRGDFNKAYQYTIKFQKITVIASLIVTFIVLMSKNMIVSLYDVSDGVKANVDIILTIFSLFFVIESYNNITVVGILRSGGDNKFCFNMDLVAVWLIGIPLALLGAFVFKLPVYSVYCLILLQEAYKFILLLKRVLSKKWMNNLVEEML